VRFDLSGKSRDCGHPETIMTIPIPFTHAIPFTRAAVALIFAMFLLGAGPAGAAPCAGFLDVDDADPFCTHVTWIKNRNITLGCTPNLYCPYDVVTRMQMAAFMSRLGNVTFQQGGNAFGAPAVLGTVDSSDVEIHAGNNQVMRYVPNANGPNIIGGHPNNVAYVVYPGQTIAGGGKPGTNCYEPSSDTWTRSCGNRAEFSYVAIGGGISNKGSREYATVAGGLSNTAGGISSAVAGGEYHLATGDYATIGGGHLNVASGDHATVPGGALNKAIGNGTFVAGRNGTATETGMFVFSDSRGAEFNPALYRAAGESANTFNVRATGVGGVWFVTGVNAGGTPTWACYAQNGTGWTCASDRNLKRNLEPIDGAEVLAKLAAMPIYRWQPKDGPNADVTHAGPMAQDFHAAFGLGDNDKAIGLQDADGVALAAIKGLYQLVQQQARDLERLRGEFAAQRAELASRITLSADSIRSSVQASLAP
jgi:Chaperone of endosialidase